MFTKKVREELGEVDKFVFELKKQLAYARHLLIHATSELRPTDPGIEEIEEFLENGLDVDYDEPDEVEMEHLRLTITSLKIKSNDLEAEVKQLNKKNHNLAKSMKVAKDNCEAGYIALGWHWENPMPVVNLDGMVKEMAKRIGVLVTYVHDYAHDDDCTYGHDGNPDPSCALCSDGDMHDIIFKKT